MSYVSVTLAAPHVFFTESTDRGATWSSPRAIESSGDRGLFGAPAISPNGTDVYVVYKSIGQARLGDRSEGLRSDRECGVHRG
jgi:hypothetical protein